MKKLFIITAILLAGMIILINCQRKNPTGPVPSTPIIADPLGLGNGEPPEEELPVDPNIYPI